MSYHTLLIVILLLSLGCTSSHRQIIAKNTDFMVIQASDKDTYPSLADEFLGGKGYAEIIQRYNPDTPLQAGSYIAIPQKSLNRSGVFVNGYQRVPVLCYHQFTNEKSSDNKMVVTRAEFESQMAYLADNNYQVVSLRELSGFLQGNKELPIKSVVITIDDGYKSYFEVAYPILKKYDFPSTMFVYPDFIGAGPALKWKDVKYLSKTPLVDIQSHSKTHDSLQPLPSGETEKDYLKRLKIEVEGAQKLLARKIAQPINHFAYPYGNSSLKLIDLLKKNDYELAVTVQKGSNPAFAAPFLLHRTMIYGGDSLNTFKRSLKVFSAVELK